ncbi:MAG: efflux RND transporter periplasmic adaptor subunit [Acidobacteriaceae bacterium]
MDDIAKEEVSVAARETMQKQPHGGPNRKGLIVVGIVCAVALGFAIVLGIHSRSVHATKLAASTRQAAIQTVTIVHPKSGSGMEELALPGDTQAFTDTPIYARTSGYIKRWYVDIGARVTRGQLLAQIETPELDQQLQQARADLKTAQANLEIAQITAARWQKLLAKNAVSVQQTDQAKSTLMANQATVAANDANVRRLQELVSFERVTAPFSGVITARNIDIGDLIAAGANTAPQELFHLAAVYKLRVYVAVPEVYADDIRTGMKVKLTQDAQPNLSITGTVVRNSNAIDPASRTLNVEVDVDNKDGQLMPGSYVFVHFKFAGTQGAVTIPSNTLLFRKEGLRVAVVHHGHVSLTPITIGRDYGDSVEVIAGLKPDDSIVLDPSDSLEDGAQVQIASTNAAGAAQ